MTSPVIPPMDPAKAQTEVVPATGDPSHVRVKAQAPSQADKAPADKAQSTADKAPAQAAKRGPGRPRKGAPALKPPPDAAKPHGNEKPPPALTQESREAAIKRHRDRLDALIREEKATNPAAKDWQETGALFQRHGARVDRSAWRPLVSGPVRLVEWLMGVRNPTPTPERVTDDEIDAAAGHWEAASIHLGMTPAGAALLGAVAGTIGTVGTAIARGIGKLLEKKKNKSPTRYNVQAPADKAKAPAMHQTAERGK